jgi:hypothetical protein
LSKKLAAALEYYRTIVKDHPNTKGAKEAKERIKALEKADEGVRLVVEK